MSHARVRCVGVIQIGEDFSKLPVSKINVYFAKLKRAHNVNEPCPHLSFSRKAKREKDYSGIFNFSSIHLNLFKQNIHYITEFL